MFAWQCKDTYFNEIKLKKLNISYIEWSKCERTFKQGEDLDDKLLIKSLDN